jgi:cell division protein FtsW (lipid II flippase)
MQNPAFGWILMAIGVVLVFVSAFADSLGLGLETTRFGWKQALGLAIGVVAFVAGLYFRRRPRVP